MLHQSLSSNNISFIAVTEEMQIFLLVILYKSLIVMHITPDCYCAVQSAIITVRG